MRGINTKKVGRYTENTPIISKYFGEVRKTNLLSKEEEESLFKIYKEDKDPKKREEAREKIILANQRFVISVAKKYAGNRNLPDLINEGHIGLMNAIEKFDPSTGHKFITYAVHYIKREVTAFLMNEPLIEKSNLQKTVFYLDKIKEKIYKKECRDATTEEIIDALYSEYDIQIKDERDLYDLNISTLDYDDQADDVHDTTQSMFNQRFYTRNDVECFINEEDDKEIIKSCLKILLKREKKVIISHFGIGLDRSYSLDEIGDAERLSSERVRQIVCRSIELMQIWFKERNKRKQINFSTCLKILSNLEKHIFTLHFVNGCTLEEISKTISGKNPEEVREILMESIQVVSDWIDNIKK